MSWYNERATIDYTEPLDLVFPGGVVRTARGTDIVEDVTILPRDGDKPAEAWYWLRGRGARNVDDCERW